MYAFQLRMYSRLYVIQHHDKQAQDTISILRA